MYINMCVYMYTNMYVHNIYTYIHLCVCVFVLAYANTYRRMSKEPVIQNRCR